MKSTLMPLLKLSTIFGSNRGVSDIDEPISTISSSSPVSFTDRCIQWRNNHQSTLLNFFDNLYNKMFADATLVLDNNVKIKYHKIVLAAYSTYLRSLFLDLPCGHQTIVLKDIKISEMMPILRFMYHGKTNVMKYQVNDVLKVAKALQVKDLVIEDSNRSRSGRMSDPHWEDAMNMTTMPLVINTGDNDVAAHSLLSSHSSVAHHSSALPNANVEQG